MSAPSVPNEHADHREFFRLDVTLAFAYQPEGAATAPRPFPTKLNLSGKGLRFTTKKRFDVGDILALVLCLPSDHPIHTFGEVMYVFPDPEPKDTWKVGVAFTDISDKDRGKIVAYIFKMQRDLLNNHYV